MKLEAALTCAILFGQPALALPPQPGQPGLNYETELKMTRGMSTTLDTKASAIAKIQALRAELAKIRAADTLTNTEYAELDNRLQQLARNAGAIPQHVNLMRFTSSIALTQELNRIYSLVHITKTDSSISLKEEIADLVAMIDSAQASLFLSKGDADLLKVKLRDGVLQMSAKNPGERAIRWYVRNVRAEFLQLLAAEHTAIADLNRHEIGIELAIDGLEKTGRLSKQLAKKYRDALDKISDKQSKLIGENKDTPLTTVDFVSLAQDIDTLALHLPAVTPIVAGGGASGRKAGKAPRLPVTIISPNPGGSVMDGGAADSSAGGKRKGRIVSGKTDAPTNSLGTGSQSNTSAAGVPSPGSSSSGGSASAGGQM